jgi:hypothetical protein
MDNFFGNTVGSFSWMRRGELDVSLRDWMAKIGFTTGPTNPKLEMGFTQAGEITDPEDIPNTGILYSWDGGNKFGKLDNLRVHKKNSEKMIQIGYAWQGEKDFNDPDNVKQIVLRKVTLRR